MNRALGNQFAASSKNEREKFLYPGGLKVSYKYFDDLCTQTYPSKAIRIALGAAPGKIVSRAKETAQIPATASLIASDSKREFSVPFCGKKCES